MDIYMGYRKLEIAHDVCPNLHLPPIFTTAETETPDHLEESQMGAVTDLVDIVRAHTILDIALACAVRTLKSGFQGLHPRADEERSRVVFRDNLG